MPRWIVFDAVGTLITPSPSVAAAYHAVGRRHGSRLDEETIRARFRGAFHATEAADAFVPTDNPNDDATRGVSRAAASLRTSEAREERRWRDIVAAVLTDVDDPEACFRELWDHFADPASWRCYDDIAATADRLAIRGFGLAIASNFDRRLHAVCDGLPALRRFGPRVVSSEVGWRKPAAAFFAALAARLDCPPDEMLLVGDDWTNDVQGATAAGLRAAWLRRDAADERPASDVPNGDVLELSSLTDLDRVI